MSDQNTNATITLHVNGEAVENELKKLKVQAADLEAKLQKAVVLDDKKTNIKKIQKDLNGVTREMGQIEAKTKQVNAVLRNLDSASPKELQAALKAVRASLNNVKRGSDAWDEHTAKIKLLKGELAKINSSMEVQESLSSRLVKKFNNWGAAIATVIAAVIGVVAVSRKAVNAYAAMEEEMAQVRKFTGMTAEEVDTLNESFKKIDTRTPRGELNKLAGEAGRLGKTSQEDVMGFVNAANQINVALSDLGEGATLEISKLADIFGAEDTLGTEKAMLSVGSTVNVLSQNCTAAAPYLVDFTSRLAGVGVQAKLTIPEIMSYAAVLDSQGQKVEMSATAFQRMIMQMFQDPAKIAKATGMDIKEFADTVKTSTNDALLMMLDRLKELGNIDVLAPMFQEMGVDGRGASSVMMALAANIEKVKSQQIEASKAYSEATSIGKEYTIQNETVQAQLDKARKAFDELTVSLGAQLMPVMTHVISGSSALLKVIKWTIDFISEYKWELVALATSITAYNIAVNLAIVKTKLFSALSVITTVALKAKTVALQLCYAAVALFSGNLHKAGQEMKILFAILKLNPWGVLIAAVTAVVGLIVAYNMRTKEASMRTEALADIQKKYNDNIGDEISKITTLQKIIQNSNLSNQTRINAINELKKIIPGYNAELTAEGQIVRENTTAVNNYIEALKRQAMAKAVNDKIAELYSEIIDNNQEIEHPKQLGFWEGTWALIGNYGIEGLKEDRQREVATLRKDNERKQTIIDSLTTDNADVLTNTAPAPKAVRDDAMYKSNENYKKDVDNAAADKAKTIAKAKDKYEKNTTYTPSLQKISPLDIKATGYGENAWGGKSFSKSADPLVIFNTAVATADQVYNEALEAASAKYKKATIPPIDGGGGGSAPDRFKAEDKEYEHAKAQVSIDNTTIQIDDKKTPEEKLAAEKAYQEKLYNLELEYLDKKIKSGKLAENEKIAIQAEILELKKKHLEEEKKLEEKAAADAINAKRDKYKEENEAYKLNLKQLLADGKISEADYKREMLNEEEFYQRRLADLYERGSKERTEADRKIEEKNLENKLKDNKAYQDELERIRKEVFGPTQDENNEAFGKAMESLDKIRDEELNKVGENKDEQLRINNQYNEKKAEYEKEYNQKSAEGATKSYQETILQSADWLQNSEGGQALTQSIDFVAQASQAIFSQLSSVVQAEQDIQLAAVNNKYDQEIAAAEGNNYKIKQLEKQKSEEEAKIKREGNKKMFAMQVIQAIATTAQAALNAYASTVQIPLVGTVLAPIAAGVAVVTGMLQVAAIKKQQQAAEAQGYFTGGFTPTGSSDHTPAGVVHANEWVANAHLLRSPIARPLIEALDYAQRTNTIGSLNSDRLAGSSVISPQVVVQAQPDAALAQSIATNTAVLSEYASVMSKLNERLNKPFVTVNTVTGDHGIQKAQSEYDNMIKNKTPKSRWK